MIISTGARKRKEHGTGTYPLPHLVKTLNWIHQLAGTVTLFPLGSRSWRTFGRTLVAISSGPPSPLSTTVVLPWACSLRLHTRKDSHRQTQDSTPAHNSRLHSVACYGVVIILRYAWITIFEGIYCAESVYKSSCPPDLLRRSILLSGMSMLGYIYSAQSTIHGN